MDENHQDKTKSKLVATADIRWKVNRKSNLLVPKHKKRTGFESKTLWDWLDLLAKLAIPIVVLVATIGFGWWQVHLADLQHQSDQRLAQQQHDTDQRLAQQQHDASQRLAQQQHDADQQRALDQQRTTILQTYIDNIQDLLLHNNLLTSSRNQSVATLARARTLTALQELDPRRKGILLQFLYEARLIGFYDISSESLDVENIDLENANLDGTVLEGSFPGMRGIRLSFASLKGANLSDARLDEAVLIGTHLERANLIFTELVDANLYGTNLEGANLRIADLRGADLREADLSGANLQGADLSCYVGTGEFSPPKRCTDLSEAKLTQQQLDTVWSCKGAILPKGLTCHNNK